MNGKMFSYISILEYCIIGQRSHISNIFIRVQRLLILNVKTAFWKQKIKENRFNRSSILDMIWFHAIFLFDFQSSKFYNNKNNSFSIQIFTLNLHGSGSTILTWWLLWCCFLPLLVPGTCSRFSDPCWFCPIKAMVEPVRRRSGISMAASSYSDKSISSLSKIKCLD